jgi:hypothetical protein
MWKTERKSFIGFKKIHKRSTWKGIGFTGVLYLLKQTSKKKETTNKSSAFPTCLIGI